jgi:hypothetical protein
MWTETGTEHKNAISSEPIRFKLELFLEDSVEPIIAIDKMNNENYMIIDYFSFTEIAAKRVKFTIIKTNKKITHGINNITIFGHSK